jgi:hypothetical protein
MSEASNMQRMEIKSKLQGRCGQRLASFIKLCFEKGGKKTSERQFSGDLGNSNFKISPHGRANHGGTSWTLT